MCRGMLASPPSANTGATHAVGEGLLVQTALPAEAWHLEQSPVAVHQTPEHPGDGDHHVEGREVEAPSRSPIVLLNLRAFWQPRHIEDFD